MPDGVYYEYSLIADGVQRGSRQAVQALKESDAAAEKLGQTIDAVALKMAKPPTEIAKQVAQAKQEFTDLERIAKASGITLDQLFTQIRLASKGTRESVQGVVATFFGQKTITEGEWAKLLPVEPLKKTGTAAAGATRGMAQARLAMISLANQAIGTNPAITRLSTALLTMGLGGTVAIAVLGGLALIGLAFNRITAETRAARAETEKLVDAMVQAAKVRNQQTIAGQTERLGALEKEQGRRGGVVQRLEALRSPEGAFLSEEMAVAQMELERRISNERKKFAAATQAVREAEQQLFDARRRTQEQEVATLATLVERGSATDRDKARLTERVKELRLELRGLGSEMPDRRAQIESLLSMIEQAETKVARPGERAARQEARHDDRVAGLMGRLDQLRASLTAVSEDDIVARLRVLDEEIRKVKPTEEQLAALTALRNEIAQLANEKVLAKLGKQFRDLTAEAVVSAVPTLQNALDDLLTAMKNAGADDSLLEKVRALKQPMIDAAQSSEELAAALEKIDRDFASGFNLTGSLEDIGGLIDKATAARDKAVRDARAAGIKPEDSKAVAQAQRELNALIEKEGEIRKKNREIQQQTVVQARTIREETTQLAGDIANAANAAFGLASAFLGVDNTLTRVLGSIGQLAGGIQKIGAATSLLGALPGIGMAIGGGLALAQSLFGKSPEEQARIQRLRENTEALVKLRDRIGTLAQVGASGVDIVRATAALNPMPTFFSIDAERNLVSRRQLERQLAEQGLSLQQFVDIMRGLDITIDATKISVADLELAFEALQQAALVRFGTSFAGQMEQFNAALQVFPDLADPTKKFAAFAKALDNVDKKSGVLGELIASFDISTPEGIAAAIEALQGLFERFQAEELTGLDIGGLQPGEFIDALLQALGILREAGPEGTGGFNIDRTITEVTGSRIGALLSTANIFAEQTAASTAGLLKLLGGGPLVPLVSPPSIPSTGAMVGGVSIGPVTVVVQVEAGEVSDPEGFGRKVARGFVQQISEGQANALSWRKRSVGNAAHRSVS